MHRCKAEALTRRTIIGSFQLSFDLFFQSVLLKKILNEVFPLPIWNVCIYWHTTDRNSSNNSGYNKKERGKFPFLVVAKQQSQSLLWRQHGLSQAACSSASSDCTVSTKISSIDGRNRTFNLGVQIISCYIYIIQCALSCRMQWNKLSWNISILFLKIATITNK